MDFTEINSRGERGELLGRIDRQNSRFRTAKTIIIKFGLHASFVELESAKNALNEVTPAFIFVIVLEQVLHLIRGKKLMRLNDSVTNISQGILVELFKIPLYGVELLFYTWIYNNWCIYSLPWNSAWTWILCLIGTDFCFYWMHRATHRKSYV
ncbi:alkylglycerol monooxygenase [Trichonephila clavipes]|nr:alkylglycerol monooxygenase [Trichonephila clavipes]